MLPLDLPCSGEEVILQCTLPGTAVIWKFPGGEITLIPASSESPGNFRARPVSVVNGSFTSTLTFPAENGTVITCINRDRRMNASQTVTIQGIVVSATLECQEHKVKIFCICDIQGFVQFSLIANPNLLVIRISVTLLVKTPWWKLVFEYIECDWHTIMDDL